MIERGSSIQKFPLWKENSRHSGQRPVSRKLNLINQHSSLIVTASHLWTRKKMYIFDRLSKSPHSPSLAFDPNFWSLEGWTPQSLDPTCLFPVSSTKLANLERLVSPPWLTAVGWERRAARLWEKERHGNGVKVRVGCWSSFERSQILTSSSFRFRTLRDRSIVPLSSSDIDLSRSPDFHTFFVEPHLTKMS